MVDVSGTDKVTPVDDSLHQGYTFWIEVNSDGGSTALMGPFDLRIGCYLTGDPSFTITDDSANFVTAVALYVGDSNVGVYTMHVPTSDKSYCVITSNVIVGSGGAAWSGDVKVSPCAGGDPTCSVFDLVDTIMPESYTFAVETKFTND